MLMFGICCGSQSYAGIQNRNSKLFIFEFSGKIYWEIATFDCIESSPNAGLSNDIKKFVTLMRLVSIIFSLKLLNLKITTACSAPL